MKKSVNYHQELIKDLSDPAEAAAYLNAALQEGESELLLVALKNVVAAQGGFGQLARRTKLNRANLYQLFSKQGNPRLQTLEKILSLLGMEISILPTKHKPFTLK